MAKNSFNSKVSRRSFLVGCSSAIAAMAGARVSNIVFSDPEQGADDEILIIIFLRGGCDGLSVVMPIAGVDRPYYEAARPQLAIPDTGPGAAIDLDGQFGLHPAAAPLHDIYQNGNLAIVLAAGMQTDTRSHFDAMEFMELGTPGQKSITSGWLSRHMESSPVLPDGLMMPSLAVGSLSPTSLLANTETITMTDPQNFALNTGPWRWQAAQRLALRNLYGNSSSWLHQAGTQALNAADIVELANPGGYVPANGAIYPNTSFGDSLQVIAQMIKLNLGLHIGTIDLGGWDTHEGQGSGSTGYFATMIDQLSQGMNALYTDLDGVGADNYTQRLTVVAQSEFGRRLKENANSGTDHGHGNFMLVMGGNVNPGLHGPWPGLHNDQLYDNADLEVATDYRQVLSEILIRRLANPNLGHVFPGYSGYTPLGVVQGIDLEPVYNSNRVFLPTIRRE